MRLSISEGVFFCAAYLVDSTQEVIDNAGDKHQTDDGTEKGRENGGYLRGLRSGGRNANVNVMRERDRYQNPRILP